MINSISFILSSVYQAKHVWAKSRAENCNKKEIEYEIKQNRVKSAISISDRCV